MEKFMNIKGYKLIDEKTGGLIGHVSDATINTGKNSIDNLILGKNSSVASDMVVSIKNITKLGENTLYVEDESIVKKYIKKKKNTISTINRLIEDVKVNLSDGTQLGIVSDVMVDMETGRIEGLELSEGLTQDLYFGRKLLPIIGKVEFGEDIIIVSRDCYEEIMDYKKGLKKLLKKE